MSSKQHRQLPEFPLLLRVPGREKKLPNYPVFEETVTQICWLLSGKSQQSRVTGGSGAQQQAPRPARPARRLQGQHRSATSAVLMPPTAAASASRLVLRLGMKASDKPPAPRGCQESRPSPVNIEGRTAKASISVSCLWSIFRSGAGRYCRPRRNEHSGQGFPALLTAGCRPPELPPSCSACVPCTSLPPLL